MASQIGGDVSGGMQLGAPVSDEERAAKDTVKVTVEYLPATKPFEHKYLRPTELTIVRSDSMAFFGVSDHKDRDTHEFFLVYEGRRLTNLSETLGQLLGPHRHDAEFHLVEQVTQGDAA